MTAAHCVNMGVHDPLEARQMFVEVGSIYLGRGQSYGIRRLAYHRQYSNDQRLPYIHPNDIGMVTVSLFNNQLYSRKFFLIYELPMVCIEVSRLYMVDFSGFSLNN